MLCLWAAQLKFWFQTDLGCENSASYARKTVAFNHPCAPQENQCLLSHFLTTLRAQEKTDCSSMLWSIMDTFRASRRHLWTTRPWLVKIWQKIYAASWILFTLTAEADRVLCQLVIFLTVFFYWMYKKWNTAAIKSILLFVASLFIGFLVERCVACQSQKSDFGWYRFRFSPCLIMKTLRRYWPYLIPFRSCISNGNVFDVCFLYLI